MKYAYYPGCALRSSAVELDLSTRAVCEALGIDLVEIPGWLCCGALSAHSTSHLLSISLSTKNLVLAKEMGLELMSPCVICSNRLKAANKIMRENEEMRRRVKQVIEDSYNGEVRAHFFLEVLVREVGLKNVKEKIRRELKGIKAVAYYGCLTTRPPDGNFDQKENPSSLDELIEEVGASALPWPHKVECCGADFTTSRTDVVMKLTSKILREAKDAGAECIVVACHLCHMNLDLRQRDTERKYREEFNLPIFYFTELLGLALGINYKQLGLKKHFINPIKFLKGKNLI